MTLIELLVVPLAALTVLSAGFGLMRATGSNEARAQNRAAASQQARFMLDGIVREVREGSGVAVAEADRLSLLTWVHRSTCGGAPATTAIQCTVTYDCSATSCTRAEGPPNVGGGTEVVAVSNISSGQIFSYSPSSADPAWVGIDLTLPRPEAGEAVSLGDGAALRNEALGA